MTEQGGDHAPSGAFSNRRFFLLVLSDNTVEGRDRGENLRILDFDVVFLTSL